ncbi:TlpA disulfide reductase family protein [Hymenobacter sp. IS2118]|uniref:TlpA disulfide reductase family protein n=1 Tax=Hymenobacter sp. IS2118 TaxID=1505605 RepID=UPI0005508D86|nr:TlpA disulfide reductase family protein [Hymenobacter sp. IS2118]
MKNLLYSALLLLPTLAQAQTEHFVLKGTVGAKAGVTKVYLHWGLPNNGFGEDSVAVKNGRFEFRGTLAEPAGATLALSHHGTSYKKSRDYTLYPFFLEQGTLTWSTPDSAAKAVVRGTPLNDAFARLQASLKPLNDQAAALRKSHATEPQLEAGLEAIEAAQQQVRADYVTAHPDARFSLFVLQELEWSKHDLERYAGWYQGLNEGLRTSPRGQRIGARIKRLQQVAVGAIAPDFTQNTPDNVPVTLSRLRGQYVLIDFWASWCGPCRQENPNVVKAYNEFKGKGFTVIGVSLDNPNGREAWLRAIAKDGLTWTQVSDLKSWNNAVAQAYGIQSVPQNFLLDPQGKIVATNLRGEELQSTLAKLLNAAN